jgi:hypothetical protein
VSGFAHVSCIGHLTSRFGRVRPHGSVMDAPMSSIADFSTILTRSGKGGKLKVSSDNDNEALGTLKNAQGACNERNLAVDRPQGLDL